MNFYLSKYGFQPPALTARPADDLEIIVVIPCFNEPDLVSAFKALKNCELPNASVEVITVINAGIHHNEEVKRQNLTTLKDAASWIEKHNTEKLRFHLIFKDDLPKKHAGVGLARKIGMDEAVHRFDAVNKDGIIVCFDADSLCEPNYLVEMEQHFKQYPKTPGCSVHYEHPIEGNAFSAAVYSGIINYELHLRYYNQALKFAGLPYAFHTVGSSMAVRSSAYQKQGGMNKRKAGEDFYFIHKIIALGNFTELKTTCIIPSPRISDRVPFGTGKAIGDWIDTEKETFKTYAFESFQILKAFIQNVALLETQLPEELDYGLNPGQQKILLKFLATQKSSDAIHEIRKNSRGSEAFKKRFFRWFDAFKVLKFVHYLRDNGIPDEPVFTESSKLFQQILGLQVSANEVEMLISFRQIEKK